MLSTVLITGCGGYQAPSMNTMTPGGPMIAELVPSSATSGGAGFTLTINGSGFGTDAVIYWNAGVTSTMYVTGKQLMGAIPASDIAMKGMVPVYVRTNGQNSNVVNFTVN
jgi:hypothetical protein